MSELCYSIRENLNAEEIIAIAGTPPVYDSPRDTARYLAARHAVFTSGPLGGLHPKTVKEILSVLQTAAGGSHWIIDALCDLCDTMRPLGPNGKHGTGRCTKFCGCEDKTYIASVAVEAIEAAGIVPTVDDATRQEVEALSDWLDDDSRQWEQLRKAQPTTGGYDWMLRLAAAERRAAELLAAAYLRRAD